MIGAGTGCSRSPAEEGKGEVGGLLADEMGVDVWRVSGSLAGWGCAWSPCGRAHVSGGQLPRALGVGGRRGRLQSWPGVCPQLGFDLVRDGSQGSFLVYEPRSASNEICDSSDERRAN